MPIPNKYLGCGYKGLVFCRNNGWIMKNTDKGLTVPKWVLLIWPKIPQMPHNLSAQFVCPSPKFWNFDGKKASSGVRIPWMHSLISSRKFEVMLCYNAHISCIVEWCIQCTSWAIAQKSHECAKYLFHAEKQWTFAKMSYLHRYLLDEAITKLCGFKATLSVGIEQISSNLKLFLCTFPMGKYCH